MCSIDWWNCCSEVLGSSNNSRLNRERIVSGLPLERCGWILCPKLVWKNLFSLSCARSNRLISWRSSAESSTGVTSAEDCPLWAPSRSVSSEELVVLGFEYVCGELCLFDQLCGHWCVYGCALSPLTNSVLNVCVVVCVSIGDPPLCGWPSALSEWGVVTRCRSVQFGTWPIDC